MCNLNFSIIKSLGEREGIKVCLFHRRGSPKLGKHLKQLSKLLNFLILGFFICNMGLMIPLSWSCVLVRGSKENTLLSAKQIPVYNGNFFPPLVTEVTLKSIWV